MRVSVRVFRAVEHPVETQKYIDGHAEVLKVVGITRVTSAYTSWRFDPDTWIVYVEDLENGRAMGGGRIQIFTAFNRLPMEGAVVEKDPKITQIIEKYNIYETAEFCGLWNSKEVAGLGIGSIILGRVGVAITTALHLKGLFALCSPATLRNCLKVGFQIIEEIGNKGTFYYPKENLIATALLIKDLSGLPTAYTDDRNAIWHLREIPVQDDWFNGPKGSIEIFYDIRIL